MSRDESAATSIEYALIGAFIFLAIIVAVGLVGENLTPIFEELSAGFP